MKSLNRRQVLSLLSQSALLAPLAGWGIAACGSAPSSTNSSSGNPTNPGPTLTDGQLLDNIENAAFQYFLNEADSNTGLIKDRALAAGGDTSTLSSIAATGFGLTGLCIGDARGYAATTLIQSRVLTTLSFLLNQMPNQNGFFYHFIDMTTGMRAGASEVSSVDTAILLCGVLTCRQYFSTNAQIVSLASQIYERVNWPWMLNGAPILCQGWLPESGFLSSYWGSYDE